MLSLCASNTASKCKLFNLNLQNFYCQLIVSVVQASKVVNYTWKH